MSLAKALANAQAQWNIFTHLSPTIKTASPGRLLAAVKDNIATHDAPTTCSSKMLSEVSLPYDATVVSLLRTRADIVGKTNMDEFGMGSGTTHSHFGPTLNPVYSEKKRVCGGSSGGSTAAVASGVVDVALGTDTGGSVRLPAAYTGVYGFKPSYGRLSRWGVVAYAQSLDTVGLLARDLGTVEEVFSLLDQYDDKDPTSLSVELREKIQQTQPSEKKLRFGVPEEFVLEGIAPEVAETWNKVLNTLIEADYDVVPVSIPTLQHALPIYYTLAPAEASSNLARYDGIRYGHRSDSDKNHYALTRSQGFGKEVQNRILLGNYNLNADSYKNHFLKAKQLRQVLSNEFDNVFRLTNVNTGASNADGIDILISPTSLTTAPTLEQFQKQSPAETYVNDVLTVPASLAGLPAISVPCGPRTTPVGIQLMAQFGNDSQVLSAAKILVNTLS